MVGEETLAAGLEFNRATEWLPYFLGTAYVRAVQDRLAKKVDRFSCPEIAINWLFQVLVGSGPRLLGRDARWDLPHAIERIYGWIELIEQAPSTRVKKALDLPWNVDLLTFLETNEAGAGVSGDARAFVAAVAEAMPAVWDTFRTVVGQADFETLAREFGDPPLRLRDAPEQVFASGWFLGTQTVQLCSGGRVQLAGWIPGGLDGRHAVALRVGPATWWLVLDEAQAARAPFELGALPHLAPEALVEGRRDLDTSPQALSMSCYFTRAGYGLPRLEPNDDRRYQRWLFDLSSDDYPHRPLLTTVVPGNGRALLEPVPAETTDELHRVNEMLRPEVSARLAVSLEQLAAVANRRRAKEVREVVEAAGRADTLACSRQRAMWSRRILRGLLGPGAGPAVQRTILEERMNMFVPNDDVLRDLLAFSYGRPCRLAGAGRKRLYRYLEGLNEKAVSSIGKPLFALAEDRVTVEYIGLWKH
jgi:hypothetical protein